MRRRDCLGLLAALTARPAHAQQAAQPKRIAVVHPALPIADMSETSGHPGVSTLLIELRRLGHVESQNLLVERYSGRGQTQRYAELTRDVVRASPDLIVAFGNRMILHFTAATRTIPIVGFASDPVVLGLVESLARPGGNVTGVVVDAGLEIWSKRFEILKEMVPRARRVGFLAPLEARVPAYVAMTRAAAERSGMMLLDAALGDAIGEAEYRRFFDALVRTGSDGLAVNEAGENLSHQRVVIELAAATRIPAIYPWREPVLRGGLVAYAFNFEDLARHAARQVDQILRGESPAGIPFRQAERFELIVNLRAAAAIALTIPHGLLARADEVIE